MVYRKRRINSSISKKKPVKKTNQDEELCKDITPFSLPVLSDEKILCEEYLTKTRQAACIEEKVPRVVLSKIKITCEPLNVEKIIDLKNPGVVHDVKKAKKPRKRQCKITNSKKSLSSKDKVNLGLNNLVSDPSQSQPLLNRKKRGPVSKRKIAIKGTEVHAVKKSKPNNNGAITGKNIKIFINGKEATYQNKSFSYNSSYAQQASIEEQTLQAGTSENFKKHSSGNLNTVTLSNQGFPCCSLSELDDEAALQELKDVNLQDLAPSLEEFYDDELKIRFNESELEKFSKVDVVTDSNVSLNFQDMIVTSDLNQVNGDLSKIKKNFMQHAVETFINNSKLKYMKENAALKKGLCNSWLINNYKCSSENCLYNHNALNLFTRKLSHYTSKFILSVVVSMRNDDLFVDVVMAAFKILAGRKIPIIWLTFLIYFVFYVTEPADSRFLKFWANSARFFNHFGENYSAANGFASLLSIFSQVEKPDEWKIIEFIRLIRQPPVQIPTNYALLLPVLKLELPAEFLTEAVVSSINTQKDVLKVYSVIIPKISLMTSSIQVIEILLKFSKLLEEMNYMTYADNLRKRLKVKVLSFKSKITPGEYPLTASFQEELYHTLNEGNFYAIASNFEKQSNRTLEITDINSENNYFQLDGDFWESMTEAMELPLDIVPSTHKIVTSPEKFSKNMNIDDKDVCERQVTRIKQFFQDCQFDLLGKYLNELRSNVIEKAAEEFINLSFKMKISLEQAVDLVKIILLSCKTENSAKVIASISITLILNLVRINEWKKAYTILFLCQEKKINLVEGKVFYFKEDCTVTQCRIALLLIEIYSFKSEYKSALDLVKKYSMFSPNYFLWKLTWKPDDETIRVKILEDLLQQIISKQLASMAFELFDIIQKEQKQLVKPVDLRKYLNEVLILLLNQDSEDALNLFEKTKAVVQLNDITVRAILVTSVRRNRLSLAKSILHSVKQDCYAVPKVSLNSFTILISSFWLEEEIYVMFDTIFDMVIAQKPNFTTYDLKDLEINVQLKTPKKALSSTFRPLCLGIIKPSFKDACSRIQRVLQYQFNPPVKLIIMPYSAKLDEHSVKVHLHKRMNRSSYLQASLK